MLALAPMLPLAHGQTAPPTTSPVPTLIVNAEEVSLDLAVHDKKDQAVLDLKPGDIAVFDAGSPVTLNSLRLVSGKPDRDCLVTLVFDRLNPNLKMLTARDVAGKSIQGVATPRSVYESIMKTARDAAEEILTIIPESGFSIAVTGVERRLRVEQGFTSDRNAIAQAVNAVTQLSKPTDSNDLSQPERELIMTALTGADASGKAVSAGDRGLAEALTAAVYDSGRIAQDRHMWPTPAALLALVQSQQNLAQRKIVIYFTFSADREFDLHAEKSMPSILAAANRAGVSLYIVDLRSLDANGTWQDEIDASRMDFAMAMKEMSLKYSGGGSGASSGKSGSSVKPPTVGSGWGPGRQIA